METPSPVPNDSGAELAADDDIEIVKVNQGEVSYPYLAVGNNCHQAY